jgi:hypothetical protein
MESNGEPNKIHVSEDTAKLIELAGKGYVPSPFCICVTMASFIFSLPNLFFKFRHWLTPREEKISAKGKGMMQTYWCEPSKFQI